MDQETTIAIEATGLTRLQALALATLAAVLTPFGGAAAQESPLFAVDSIAGVDFREVGPSFRSGRVVDMAVDPRSPGTWYVASASGGVWKTTSGGVEWTPIFDDQGSYSIGTVVLDPTNSDVVWVGTGENNSQRSVSFGDGVYRSTDGGRTWRNMGLRDSEHIGKILFDPRDPDVIYVAAQGPLWRDGGDRGLYRTRDGGESWERVLHVSESTGISDVIQHEANPDVLLAASYQRRRHTGILIGGGPEGTIYKSTDGGDSWREADHGLPSVDRGRIGLAFSPQRPEVAYAVVTAARDSSGFYRSDDAGETWQRSSDWAPGDPQYYQELFPSPHETGVIFGIEIRLMRSEDDGATWERFDRGVHVDQHHVQFDPNDPDHLWIGNDGGLYETFDYGETWRYFDNLPLMQFYRVGVDDSWPFYRIGGGTQDNGTVVGYQQTRNGAGILNAHFGSVTGGDGFEVEFDSFDPDVVYTESQNGVVRRSNYRTDEQVRIRPEDPDTAVESRWYWDTPIVASRHAPGRVYVASERVWRSGDRGDTWTAISGDLTRQIDRDTVEVMGRVWPEDAVWKNVYTSELGSVVSLDESRLDPDLLVAGTDDGVVQITEDGGRTWLRVERVSGVPETGYVADVVASRHRRETVYAVFNNHKRGDFRPYLARSDDLGATWRLITDGIDAREPLWSLAEDGEDRELLFLGAEFGAYASPDGGRSWTKLAAGLPVAQVRELTLQDREDDLVLATFGRGFWIMDDISYLRQRDEITPSTRVYLFQPRAATSYLRDLGVYRPSAAQHFRAPNPEYGAPLTFWVSPDASFDSSLAVVVRERGDGEEVHRIELEQVPSGLARVTWGLTRTVERPEEEQDPDDPEDETMEVPIREGDFEAAVVHVTGDGDEVLTPWRGFSVDPLPTR